MENLIKIAKENGFENCKYVRVSIRKIGTASYKLTAEIGIEVFTAESYDSNLYDDFNETTEYFESNNSGHWFDSAEQVDEEILKRVLIENVKKN